MLDCLFGAIPASPAWHRNQRRKRHLARRRVKVRKSCLLHPLRKDLELLSAHHTRPKYKLPDKLKCHSGSFESMAKWNSYGYSDASGSEYYAWPAVQHPWSNKGGWKGHGKGKAASDKGNGKNQQKGAPKVSTFPQYDHKSPPQIVPVKSKHNDATAKKWAWYSRTRRW